MEDPTLAVCPSFEDREWDFLRQSVIDSHRDVQPLTAEEATQRMKDAWSQENGRKIIAWNVQVEEDRAEREQQERTAQEEEHARQVQREKEAEEQRKEADKKKPKLHSYDPDRLVDSWIGSRPAPYAINKINALEYVELDYFTARGCREAAVDTGKSISHDTLAFTQIDDTIAIRPLASLRPSRHIRNDEDLGWEEMLQAKNTMLRFMALSGTWPVAHAQSLAAFYVALELHPRMEQANGKRALLLYQSRVRREWFAALKRDEGFNIERIQDNLLRALAELVNDNIRDGEMNQVWIIF